MCGVDRIKDVRTDLIMAEDVINRVEDDDDIGVIAVGTKRTRGCFSAFGFINNKLRNKLNEKTTVKLVYVYANGREGKYNNDVLDASLVYVVVILSEVLRIFFVTAHILIGVTVGLILLIQNINPLD